MRSIQRLSVAVLLTLVFCAGDLDMNGEHVEARTLCSYGDKPYIVIRGDTLSGIASRYGANWRELAAHNHIANANLIYVHQVICISARSAHQRFAWSARDGRRPARSTYNAFPYGSCTWWANQRYFQLHGVFVPWRTQANAWQWTARAYQFGWHVSTRPTVGAIIDLQPWVEGAYGFGHVAVVERILRNGHVIASNMSWGAHPLQVTYVEFAPGPGVDFVIQ